MAKIGQLKGVQALPQFQKRRHPTVAGADSLAHGEPKEAAASLRQPAC